MVYDTTMLVAANRAFQDVVAVKLGVDVELNILVAVMTMNLLALDHFVYSTLSLPASFNILRISMKKSDRRL
jgi:hypothetical protein